MDENYIPKKEGYKTLVHWCDSCKNKDECKAGYEKKRGWCTTFIKENESD